MVKSIQKHVPELPAKANKPWIRQGTLSLIAERLQARASADRELEQKLHKEVQKSARKDRAEWLKDLAGSGDWNSDFWAF